MTIVLLNLLYALLGGGAAIAFMFVGYKVIDHLTRSTRRSNWRTETGRSAPRWAACSSASVSPSDWSSAWV